MDRTRSGMTDSASRIASADALAIARILAVSPELFALERAADRLRLKDHELLHAGPPLNEPTRPCTPVLNAAVAAILFEGWADTPDNASDMVRSGKISLRPALDLGCAVPLADVLSPSMWLQVVRDAAEPQRWACSPINGGPTNVMRAGVFDLAVVTQLRWLDQEFAPAYRAAIAEAAVPLIPLADQGLAAGDDCHGKTVAASAAFARVIHDRLRGPSADACRVFVARSPAFFLNLWMAASRAMLSAAAGTADSSVVTAAGGNGLDFGIQLAGKPGRWFTTAASAPLVPHASEAIARSSLGAIGDSAIVDLLGLGAMTTRTRGPQEASAFAGLWPETASAPAKLLSAVHPAFEHTRARLIVRATSVVDAASSPVISLGVLDKEGLQGRLGGGFYRAPAELFVHACAELLA
jgi:hypothetical protein